jgi:predicted ferric reductase
LKLLQLEIFIDQSYAAKMIRKENGLGWSLVFSTLLATWAIWLTTLASYAFIWKDPFLFVSKAVVLPGTILMCWSFFFSTRLPLFNKLFGGLDKTYHAHKITSISSFVCICLHPTFQFFRFLPNYRKSLELFIPRALTAIEFGILALLLFIALISLTLWIKIPYHIWKRTHEYFILVMLLAMAHVWLIDKQVHDSIYLMGWMYGFMIAACIAYFYTRFLYRFFGPRYTYSVADIEKKKESWDVYLTPKGSKRLIYQPAQFIYISFKNASLGDEPHPFSVSSAPENELRLSIKGSGDYTSKLDRLKRGDEATIWGPYGKFYEKYLCEPEKAAVMIAGGIGITPFLSLLQHEIKHPTKRKTTLFYGVKNRQDTDYVDELKKYVDENPQIQLFVSYYEEEPLNISFVEKQLSQELKHYNHFLCGPIQMMKLFEKELKTKGIRNQDIVYEDFNLFD